MPITLIARLTVKKGMEERGRRELSQLVPRSREDKGCLQYDLHQALEDKTAFMFYERWESLADLDKHKAMSFMKEFGDRCSDLFDGPNEITLWDEVSS